MANYIRAEREINAILTENQKAPKEIWDKMAEYFDMLDNGTLRYLIKSTNRTIVYFSKNTLNKRNAIKL